MKKMQFILVYTFILTLMLSAINVNGQSSMKERIIELTFTGGAWLYTPSKIWSGDIGYSSEKSISPLFKIMGDAYVNPHFAVGAYLTYGSGFGLDLLPDDIKTSIFEYGGGFKPVFYFNDKTCMKVGINVGLRKSYSDYEGTTGQGLGVNCSVEIQHLIGKIGSLTIEPGFLSQPVGYSNNDTEEYDYAPIFYLNIGFTISSFKK